MTIAHAKAERAASRSAWKNAGVQFHMEVSKDFLKIAQSHATGSESQKMLRSDRADSRDAHGFVARDTARTITRRRLLSGSLLLAGGVAVSGLTMIGCSTHDENPPESSFAGGNLLDTIKFVDEGDIKTNTILGTELDGRLFFNHSVLTAGDLVTPTDKFYIRTRASKLLDLKTNWSISIGDANHQTHLSANHLVEKSEPFGLHLMECAGNPRGGHFGLVSLASWDGVPILSLFDQVGVSRAASRLLISGFDTYISTSETSIPGASWIFSADDLAKSGAFLATKMNGNVLTLDHGAPLRLIVPGWYGCCCIKWVNKITLVQNDAKVTSQMQEYASRTHQNGTPTLARDYDPATVDAAAMPIRVERWRVNGRIQYKVVGIHWGGARPIKSLSISFNGGADWVPVRRIDERAADSWALWNHPWTPKDYGAHRIRMRVGDPMVRTRRLDMGYYDRVITIPAN